MTTSPDPQTPDPQTPDPQPSVRPAAEPTVLRARSPLDLLAFAPLALGFLPEESLVVLTMGDDAFHARIDLPTCVDDIPLVVEAVLSPAVRHRVGRVVLIGYAADARLLAETLHAAHDAYTAAGVEVIEMLRAHGGRWWPMLDPGPGSRCVPGGGPGTAYDLSSHAFTAQSVLEGHVVLASREELAASLAPREHEVGLVEAALAQHERRGTWLPTTAWVTATLRRQLALGALGTRPSASDVALLGLALHLPEHRDAAWTWMSRANAATLVDLWVDVVGRLPRDLVAGPAAVLAMTAWISGQGALARCAVERCREQEPEFSLARLVADLLDGAVSPREWDRMSSRMRGEPPAA